MLLLRQDRLDDAKTVWRKLADDSTAPPVFAAGAVRCWSGWADERPNRDERLLA